MWRSRRWFMIDYARLIVSQLEFYWDTNLWPRLTGLTDDEYFWEPADGCWTLRSDENGKFVLDMVQPEPKPPPLTTLAWRIIHVATVMSTRTSTFFGPETDKHMFHPDHQPAELPGTADGARRLLADSYHDWHTAITALDQTDLERPLGPKGAFFANEPMIALILHITAKSCTTAARSARYATSTGQPTRRHDPRRRARRRIAPPIPGRPGPGTSTQYTLIGYDRASATELTVTLRSARLAAE
nr:DinB family protein [Actinoplanes rishiriensis]